MIFLLSLALRVGAAADLGDLVHSCVREASPCAALRPAVYPARLESRSLDLADLLHAEFRGGTAYAATAARLVDRPLPRIRAFFAEPGALLRFVAAVRTQSDVVLIRESGAGTELKLAIRVPVVPNFHTQDLVRFVGEADGRAYVEWSQTGDAGDLRDNHGLVLFEAAGAQTRVFVLGAHIIKDENSVPWVGRSVATNFGREHYAGYITALEELVKK